MRRSSSGGEAGAFGLLKVVIPTRAPRVRRAPYLNGRWRKPVRTGSTATIARPRSARERARAPPGVSFSWMQRVPLHIAAWGGIVCILIAANSIAHDLDNQ